MTASSAVEYAFEGAELTPGALPEPSVFTGALVRGLTSGDADRDGDGWVGLHELFGYVTDEVRRSTPHQTPHLWAFGSEGELLIAHSGRRTITARTPPAELLEAAASSLPATRMGVALELRELLVGPDLALALGAWQALSGMLGDDSRRVEEAVRGALDACTLILEPPELIGTGARASTHEVQLVGPPLARSATVAVDEPWLQADVDEAVLRVTVTPEGGDERTGHVLLTTPVGEQTLTVTARPVRPVPPRSKWSHPLHPPHRPHPRPARPTRAPVGEAARTGSPVWIAPVVALLLIAIAVACSQFVDWGSELNTYHAGSPHLLAVPAVVLAVVLLVSAWRTELASVALGAAAGGLLAYLGFGIFVLLSYLRYDADVPKWLGIISAAIIGTILVIVAMALRGDLAPPPRLAVRSITAVVLLVLGAAGMTAGLFVTNESNPYALTDISRWCLLLAVVPVLVAGVAVLADGTRGLRVAVEAAAYAVLATIVFLTTTWLDYSGALNVLVLPSVLGAVLLGGAAAVAGRTGTRQAGP